MVVDRLLRAHGFDGQLPTSPGLLQAIEDVENWAPSRSVPVLFARDEVKKTAPEQFLSKNCPAALRSLGDPLRANADGGPTGDDTCDALLNLAARAYPALLAEAERKREANEQAWVPIRFRIGQPNEPAPVEYRNAAEAVHADPRLCGLFEDGARGLQTTFDNGSNALRLNDPAELLIHGA